MSDKKTPTVNLWMPWFIKDHRAHASTFDHVEHSAWTYLKMLLWEHEGTIRDDDKWIAKKLHLSPAKWKSIRGTVLCDYTVANGSITCPKTVEEIVRAKANIEQKRRAGLASAKARKRATAVERALNGRTNGDATARQPRAGRGEGSLSKVVVNEQGIEDGPFRIVGGGK